MIQYSDNPDKMVAIIRTGLIEQLKDYKVLKLEDYEELFNCEITGLDVPAMITTRKEVEQFRKKLKVTLVNTSATEFTFYDVKKIFNETKELYSYCPYSQAKNTRISDIPLDAVDREGKNVYETFLADIGLKKSDLTKKNMQLFTEKLERETLRNKTIIDTQGIRESLIHTCVENNQNIGVFREDVDAVFSSTHNSYHSKFTRNLPSKAGYIREIKTNMILDFVRQCPDMSYEAIGKIFGRTRQQIRDIARDHGLYRYDNGRGIHNQTVEGVSWSAIKIQRQQSKESREPGEDDRGTEIESR